MRPALTWSLLACSFLLVGCGDDDGDSASSGVPGTRAAFDLAADLADPAHFYDAPYPSDLRLDADRHPQLAGYPNPKSIGIVDGLVQSASEARGFPTLPVIYFHFDGALAPRLLDDVVPGDKTSPILLVDVDAKSPEHGRLIPVVALTTGTDVYLPEHLLAIAPRPGFVLRPDTSYGVVVMRSANDETGSPLGVPPTLARLALGKPRGDREKAAAPVFAPLFETLGTLELDPKEVAAATVFTTGDVVKEVEALSSKVREKYDVTLANLALYDDPEVTDLCILQGTVELPQFQTGKPPFSSDGRFEFDASGAPVEQRKETAPFKIVLPKSPMPAAGYPLVLNVHGSGGFSVAMVRPVLDDGTLGPAIGPAFPYANRGFAMAGMAMPLNPERLPGAASTAYLNANNLAAIRDTFRQGTIELRLFLQALEKLEIPPSALGSCTGPTLPAGATSFHFDTKKMALTGQSMGGMLTNILGPIEPHLRVAVPTGAGGHWTHFIMHTPLSGGKFPALIKLVLAADEPLSFVHPVLGLGAAALEAADPIVYVPRLAKRPLAGHPVRPIYEPSAPQDSYFDTLTYDAMALAYEHPQAGTSQWSSMQDALTLKGLDGLVPFPIENNLKSEDGTPYTGAVMQFAPKNVVPGEVLDGHAIYSHRDDVKYQYSCFIESFFATGSARIPALKDDFKAPCE